MRFQNVDHRWCQDLVDQTAAVGWIINNAIGVPCLFFGVKLSRMAVLAMTSAETID